MLHAIAKGAFDALNSMEVGRLFYVVVFSAPWDE